MALFVIVERLGRLLDEPLARRAMPLDRPGPARAASARPVVFLVNHLRTPLCLSGLSML
jgi:hypothetical protein